MANKMRLLAIMVLTVLFSVGSLFAQTVQSAKEDLESDDDAKIIAAADFLGSKKEASAVPKLSELTTNPNMSVRLHSVMALGNIGKNDAVEALNAVLVNDENAQVRYAALLSTIRIGSDQSNETLEQIIETETDPLIQDLLTKREQKRASGKKK